MGTRADFYVGLDKNAEWIGSIAWDGMDIPDSIWEADDAETFRHQVAVFLATRDDATLPSQGWPWPWNDSGLTDCVYLFGNGVVYGNAGDRLLPRVPYQRWMSDGDAPKPEETKGALAVDYPDMTARKNFTLGKRSGMIVMGG